MKWTVTAVLLLVIDIAPTLANAKSASSSKTYKDTKTVHLLTCLFQKVFRSENG